MKLFLRIAVLLLSIAYPFIILFFMNKGIEPRYFSFVLIFILIAQVMRGNTGILAYILPIVWGILITLLIIFNNEKLLRLYPLIINGALFVCFFASLKYPPTVIEQFARLQEKTLPEKAIRYCRNVTKAWCIFFIFNATVSVATLYHSLTVWAFYNGFLSYIFIGLFFSIEYLIRLRKKRRPEHAE